MDKTILEKVNTILKNAQGHVLDICVTLYKEYLAPSEDPAVVLQLILQYDFQVGTSDAPPELVSDETVNRVGGRYYGLLHEIVCILMNENAPVEVFYQKLYEQVFLSPLFPKSDEERAVLLGILLEKIPELPYYQAFDLLQQSNAEYQEAFERLVPQIRQAVHMINRRFGTRTEETSQLVRIASEIESETDRIIYWSALISLLKNTPCNSTNG